MGIRFRDELYFDVYKSDKSALLDFLDNASYDELLEINLEEDSFKHIFHVEGKYVVASTEVSTFSDLVKYAARNVVHREDRDFYLSLFDINTLAERLKNNKIPNFLSGIFRYKLQNGKYRYVEQILVGGEEHGFAKNIYRLYVLDVDSLISRQIGSFDSKLVEIEEERNELTGLLSGKAFITAANKLLKEGKEKWCFVSIDIEHFRFFSQWYGEGNADNLIKKIGAILLEKVDGVKGVSGYFGYDDFVFLAPFDMNLIASIYDAIRNEIISFDLSSGFMPAFGVVEMEEGMVVSDAFERANVACETAKGDIRNRIVVYNQSIRFKEEQEYHILSEFMEGLNNKEITFYLQPQCRISSKKVVGAEALSRWIKKDGRIIPPDSFVPILEKFGFIIDLDKYIWDRVCAWLRSWIDGGHQAVPISINVSRMDIFSIDVHQYLVKLTEKYHLPHTLIKVEITESAYIETSDVISSLVDRLRKDKFLVLMDDFGSGYSSLNMLRTISVDAIKLDTNFLNFDKSNEKGVHILESVVNMAKQLALPIIVEGVEKEKQSKFLEDIGCRYMQGFYFYRPMPVEQFEELIKDGENIDNRGFVAKLNNQFRIREFLDKNVYSDSMLNNILGPVAIYSWHGERVDIVRFNEQFYQAVNVPDFHDRLEGIEQFLPDEDKPKIYQALQKAIDDKLSGSTEILRFAMINGNYSFFSIHFYYLGKKEDGERFYGSATNVTELMEYAEERRLIANYSNETFIFVRRVYDKWVYSVVSHYLENTFGLTSKELEEEMNSGKFFQRATDMNAAKKMMEHANKLAASKADFAEEIWLRDKNNVPRLVRLSLSYVKDKTVNIVYLLRSSIVK